MSAKIWPTLLGDHRAARRGDGDGAAQGRVRWRRELGGQGWGSLVDEQGRIFIDVGDTVRVFDRAGGDVAVFRRDRSLSLVALRDDLVLLADERRIVACDLGGAVRWSFVSDKKLAAHALGPGGELVVWIMPERAWRARSELRWLDERGAVVRCEPFPCTITGLVMDAVLAFDDAGVLYALLTARRGDGVSGNDQAVGATAAFDASGCLWSQPVHTDDGLHGLHATASGALIVGHGVRGVDRSGATLWQVTHRDRQRIELIGAATVLETAPALAQLPVVLRAYPQGGGQYLARSFDRAGNSYFTGPSRGDDDTPAIVSFDREYRLRWTHPFASDGYDHAPLIGPDATVLAVLGSSLVAIE